MASVTIYKSQVESVMSAIKLTREKITGSEGCGKELETILKTLGTYWKSEKAVSFANAACKDLNTVLKNVHNVLSNYGSSVAKNANQWWESEGSPERVEGPGIKMPFNCSSTHVSEIEIGKGGKSGETVIPTSAEAATIASGYDKIQNTMTVAFSHLGNVVNYNPNAFRGAGQAELASAVSALSTASKKCMLQIKTAFQDAMKEVGATTDENVETSKKNLSVSTESGK